MYPNRPDNYERFHDFAFLVLDRICLDFILSCPLQGICRNLLSRGEDETGANVRFQTQLGHVYGCYFYESGQFSPLHTFTTNRASYLWLSLP